MAPEDPPDERREATERVRGLLGRILGEVTPGRSSLVPKLSREQIDRLLDIAEQEQRREDELRRAAARYTFALACLTLLTVALLCWLFLYFGQQDYIDKMIIALLGGLAGSGFSLGMLFRGRSVRNR